jgi:hypothetical protein
MKQKNKSSRIETIEKCNEFLARCRANGWQLWQMQYRWNEPEGFHAWFMKPGEPDIEIITYNRKVQEAIVGFEP